MPRSAGRGPCALVRPHAELEHGALQLAQITRTHSTLLDKPLVRAANPIGIGPTPLLCLTRILPCKADHRQGLPLRDCPPACVSAMTPGAAISPGRSDTGRSSEGVPGTSSSSHSMLPASLQGHSPCIVWRSGSRRRRGEAAAGGGRIQVLRTCAPGRQALLMRRVAEGRIVQQTRRLH
jgi:hypothetical protein